MAPAPRTQGPGADYGNARPARARAAGAPTTTAAAEAVVVAEDGVVVESPLEEEIWFDESRREQAGPGAGAGMGSSRSLGTAGSSSSLMPPIGETHSPLPPVLSPASGLLYEPPQWGGMADHGGGIGGGASRSRQASDASSTASVAAAAAGASVRDMFKYIRSKAAAVATTAAYYSSDDNATATAAASAVSKPATTTTGATAQGRTVAAEDSISSLNYSSGGDGGSQPATPGAPQIDEALPPGELWGGEREDTARAAAFAAASAHAEAREVSEAAQRAARDASDASSQSTAQTLLSMVRPSYWRTTSSEGGGAADVPVAAGGALGGGGGESGRDVGREDSDRGSVGFAGAGSSVEGNGSCPADESMMGSLCESGLSSPPLGFSCRFNFPKQVVDDQSGVLPSVIWCVDNSKITLFCRGRRGPAVHRPVKACVWRFPTMIPPPRSKTLEPYFFACFGCVFAPCFLASDKRKSSLH